LNVSVVGAGIVGLCAAWHLVKRGAKVTLIDREGLRPLGYRIRLESQSGYHITLQ
jgi:glycine/D-amino acid oxidase-like deaminating enzyme